MSDVLLRIGEFARLVQLPVRTVRYYGDIGLVPPSDIDGSTGYRLYRLDEVERVNRVLALKQLGLSLDEIASVLADALDDEQFKSLLEHHVARLETELGRTAGQLQRAKDQLQLLIDRMERPMPDVTVKTTEPKTIAYIREQISGVEGIAPLFPRLFGSVDPAVGVDVAGNIYHHFAEDGSSIDVEAVLPVPDDFAPAGEAQVRTIPPVQVASLMHHGAFNRLHEAHGSLLRWVEENDYQVSGPAYEWNLVCTEPVTPDNETYVTEVQVEVTKA